MISFRSAAHIIFLLTALLLPLPAESFLQPQRRSVIISNVGNFQNVKFSKEQNKHRYMTTNNNNDDDDYIDEDSLGDWRSFRMNLANSADEATTTTTSSSIDGIDLSEDESSSKTITSESSSSSTITNTDNTSSQRRPKSVSKPNEQLLSAQNAALAEEYLNGVWAHESSIPEVGGLVCRMPLESEIYRGSPDSILYQKLAKFLDSDEYDRTEDVSSRNKQPPQGSSIRSTTSSSSSSTASQSMSSFSALAAKTVFWYRGAQKLLKQELVKIMSTANVNGRIDPNDLDEESLELLQLYMDHQSTWQEVCLVTEMNTTSEAGGGKKKRGGGGSKTITINRPMAFKLSKSMARLVLMGAYQAGEKDSPQSVTVTRKESDGRETQNLVKFLGAFENQCAVYVGGPDEMDKPAVLIHGIADLPGAVEISRGTGIYQGGLEAGE
jgi:hypothetical protein